MRLLWAIDHGLQRVSKRMRQRFGITGPQRLVIRVIGRFPGISAGDLAATLVLHPSTLTGVLARLATAGLVARTPDPGDRRRVRLTLTARGRAVDRLKADTAEAVIRGVLARSNANDYAAAGALLMQLADALGTSATLPERRIESATSRRPAPPRRPHATQSHRVHR
jgi:MarR family transcriptional regulator, organic hydroperoxide resistance regulator